MTRSSDIALAEATERQQKLTKRMVDGALGGRTAVAAPTRSPKPQKADLLGASLDAWSKPGTILVSALADSCVQVLPFAAQKMSFRVDLAVAGSSSTVITVYKNGAPAGTITVAAAALSKTEILTGPFAVGDRLQPIVSTAGTGAKSATVTAKPA